MPVDCAERGTSMKIHTRLFIAGILALSLPAASRAASVEAWAGVVGGAGTGSIPNNCTSFGVPAELAPVLGSGSLQMQVLGGNAACGYSGGWTDKTAATGPLSNSASLAPVLLGNPGFTGSFDGTSSSQANFGSLSAAAHGNISGGTPGSPVALFDSQGASLFTDTLTATSPVLANGSTAFVQYLFAVSGNLSALGAPGPSLFGSARGQVSLTMNNGPALDVVTAAVNRGGLGTVNSALPAGWSTSTGALSGSSTVNSVLQPVTVGTPWQLRVGLVGWAYGTADTSFFNASLIGIQLFDSQQQPVQQFSLTSESGIQYVPEPSTALLLSAGIVGLALRRRGAK
jgi:hypothetical protein